MESELIKFNIKMVHLDHTVILKMELIVYPIKVDIVIKTQDINALV